VHDVRRVDRLAQIHVEPGGPRLANAEALGEERHGDRRHVAARRERANRTNELEPVLAGQPEVAHDDVDLGAPQELARFRCGGGRDDAHAERLEGRGEQHDGIAMVVDDQGLDSRKYRHWVTSHIVSEFGQSMGRARGSASAVLPMLAIRRRRRGRLG
jgi:hypothetical protein